MATQSASSKKVPTIGTHYAKTDLERFGIFAEMMYLHGLGYTFPKLYGTIRDEKGKQMLTSGPKWKVEGLQDCYFDKEFKRLFEGEAKNTAYKLERKNWKETKAKFLTPGGFKPQKGHEISSTPGDQYGTFSGKIEAFSPKEIKSSKQEFKRAFPVRSSKKGGPGYVDITIGQYPSFFSSKERTGYFKEDKSKRLGGALKSGWPPRLFDPLKPFAPLGNKYEKTYKEDYEKKWTQFGRFYPPASNKMLGGMKGGGFSKFPEHKPEKYVDQWRIEKYGPTGKFENRDKGLRPFYPQARNKTYPIFSPKDKVIDNSTTLANYRTKKPMTYTREFVML